MRIGLGFICSTSAPWSHIGNDATAKEWKTLEIVAAGIAGEECSSEAVREAETVTALAMAEEREGDSREREREWERECERIGEAVKWKILFAILRVAGFGKKEYDI